MDTFLEPHIVSCCKVCEKKDHIDTDVEPCKDADRVSDHVLRWSWINIVCEHDHVVNDNQDTNFIHHLQVVQNFVYEWLEESVEAHGNGSWVN